MAAALTVLAGVPSLAAMQTALAHITATDVGFGLGLFFLGLALGALLVARFRDVRRER